MSSSSPQEVQIMGPPEPLELRWPTDWNEVPFYFIIVGLGLVMLFGGAGSLIYDAETPVFAPALVWAGAAVLSLAPLALLYTTIRYVARGKAYRFATEEVSVPPQWLFGKSKSFRYDQVERIESVKNARKVHLADGRVVRLSSYRAVDANIIPALELRVGYAKERKEQYEDARDLYENASYYHDPSLDARLAAAEEPLGEIDEALEHLTKALIEHEQTFGLADPRVVYLQQRLDSLQKNYPEAESFRSKGDLIAQIREQRQYRSPHLPPPMEDRWRPISS